MVLLKELSVLKEGVKCYLINKNTYIKLGILYDVIKKFNNNKFYYNIKTNLNISNKIFKNINELNARYYKHDLMTYEEGVNLTKRIILRLLNHNTFYYKERYVNKEECIIFKYYLIIELFSKRLFTSVSFSALIKIASYLFNLNYDNDNFNNYISYLNNDDLYYILEYHKFL